MSDLTPTTTNKPIDHVADMKATLDAMIAEAKNVAVASPKPVVTITQEAATTTAQGATTPAVEAAMVYNTTPPPPIPPMETIVTAAPPASATEEPVVMQPLANVMGQGWRPPAERTPPPTTVATVEALSSQPPTPPVRPITTPELSTPHRERPFFARMQALADSKVSLNEEQAALLRDRNSLAEQGANSAEIDALQRSLTRVRNQLAYCTDNLRLYERTQAMMMAWEELTGMLAQAVAHIGEDRNGSPSLSVLHQEILALEEDINHHLAQISALEQKEKNPTAVN